MSGVLYIVATPIGNLDDITIRALQILKKVDIIAAEDTRHTLKLLNHFQIAKPLVSYYKQTEKQKSNQLINELKAGKNIALVSDAGTPGISDPGEVIIKKAIEEGITVTPIPGACAMINALVASGLSSKEFTFIGFLPVNKSEKEEKLKNLIYEKSTLIFYEAPHKMAKTLETILNVLGNRNIVLARELTKIHEEFIRGKVSDIIKKCENLKGEFVILLEGAEIGKEEANKEELSNLSLEEHYTYYEKQGLDKKEIIKLIAKDRKTNKNEIYQKFITKRN